MSEAHIARWSLAGLALLLMGGGLLPACLDPGAGPGPAGGAADDRTGAHGPPATGSLEYPELGDEARFDLAASRQDAFFAFPWPSDLRKSPDGHLDLTAFPTQDAVGTLLDDFITLTEQQSQGFSNVTAVYFTFVDSLDPSTLPADPSAAAAPDSTVYLIDIDPSSPWYGRRHPAQVVYRDPAGVYYDPHTLIIQPLYGFPLRNGNLYAAVVTTDVKSADGLPAVGPQAWRDVLDGSAPADLTDSYAPLFETLDALGIDRNTVAVATVFTTSAPALRMRQLRSWIRSALPQPTADAMALYSDGNQYDLYTGTFPFIEMQDGTTPFRRFGEGTVTVGPDGEPQTQVPVNIRWALSIPSGEMPADGWPLVLYHHGTGGDYLSFTRNATASELARRGVAVLGIDQPLHGTRNPTTQDSLDLITSLSVSNLIASAGMLVQGVGDLMQVTRLLRAGIVIPADISATGEEIRTDPNRLAFMGHSQGAQTGALFMAIEDEIPTGVLSEGAGGAAISAILRKDNDIDIEQVISLALGISGDDEPLTTYHPVLGCIAQPLFDFADPLSYARHTVLEPLGAVSHNLVMTIGYQDKAAPPPGIEALASTTGLPVTEPVQVPIATMALQGIPSVALPASGNLPEVNGHRATGALLQFPNRNHYLVSQDVGAQYQVYEFLATALYGEPWIYPAEDL